MADNTKDFNVTTRWDTEAQVWVAISDDVPGLVTEAPSLQELIVRLQVLIPELCKLNAHLMETPLGNISISANYQRFEEELRVA